MKKRTEQYGFTLIELAVVIAMLAILLGLVSVNLFRAQNTVSISATTQQVITDLRQQQIKAMVGDSEGRGAPDVYGIHFNSGSYVLFHGSTYSATDSANRVITLDSGSEIVSVNQNIIFARLSGDLTASNAVTLRDPSGTQRQTVHLNPRGVVDWVLKQ